MDKKQVIGASLLYFSLGKIDFTDETGYQYMEYSPNEFATAVSYARRLSDQLSLGISLRFIYSNLTGGVFVGGSETKAGTAVSADISSYYHKEIALGDKNTNLAFGINISNIGSKMTYTESAEKDFIPINLRLGTAWRMDLDKFNTLCVLIDVNKLLVPSPPKYDSTGINILAGKDPNRGIVSGMFGSFNDAPAGFTEEIHEFTYSLGLEYWYDKQFALRAGYFNEHATKGNRKYFAVGAGLKYNVFGVDFAYLIPTEQRHPLENTLRFTLLFDFNAFKGKSSPLKDAEEKKADK
ncbi:type IX secretion system outer membrane channel protein PorV [Bacteroidales bacterium AH-315-N07]|nr:type IX secretion system outer membrane channel protein PorV [Bacteroidales bacterium AH-315-N07]